jgi:hypothetical protein
MSETATHVRLVGLIVEWIKTQYAGTPALCLFCDCPPILETEKPRPIEGFFPDVSAATTPPALTLIGEAKTIQDLETPRSYQQLSAFLRFLSARPEPALIMATQWQAAAAAKNVVARAVTETNAQAVRLHFLTDREKPC